MQPITRILVIVSLVIGTVGVSSYATYRYYYPKALASGRSMGYNQGYDKAKSDDKTYENVILGAENSLRSENEQLRTENQRLASLANAAAYKAQKPVNCSSTNYGITNQFTSTTCY